MDREKEYKEKLLKIRDEIDAIDKQMMPLLISRMKCSERVAALKREAGKPVYDPVREAQILDAIRSKDEEYGDSLAAIYTSVMSVSRSKQHELMANGYEIRDIEKTSVRSLKRENVKVLCQGMEGAYSQRAAMIMFPDIKDISFKASFAQVFDGVVSGEADYGILPVENSVGGSVFEVYKLLLKHRCYIVEAVRVKADHCLAVYDDKTPVHTVVSHPQALRQCENFIRENNLKSVEFSNTAAAAEYVKEDKLSGVAAICSVEAAKSRGLTVIKENIQNEAHNTTRFVLISKSPILPIKADKISLCFSLPHVTGSLYNILENFAIHGLNLTKIESVPISGRHFEYDFYLDFAGNIHDFKTLELICSMHDELVDFSFLGNYKEYGEDKLSTEIKIMKVTDKGQIETAAQIAEIVWKDTYEAILPKGQTQYMIEKFQSPQAMTNQIENLGYKYHLLYLGGKEAGFFAYIYDCNKAGEMLLSKIYIKKDFQGRGLVKAAMEYIKGKAESKGMDKIWLTVNKENIHAQDVYKHYGFKRTKSVVSDIGNGYVMDDYIMEYGLI